MKALVVSHRYAQSVINLDKIEKIEFDESTGDLLFWQDRVPYRYNLGQQKSDVVMARVLASFVPLYEGRSMFTHGIRLDLDLHPLDNGTEPF